jgi:hypothetical protein
MSMLAMDSVARGGRLAQQAFAYRGDVGIRIARLRPRDMETMSGQVRAEGLAQQSVAQTFGRDGPAAGLLMSAFDPKRTCG